jgi:CRP-like cAMP-binding protein
VEFRNSLLAALADADRAVLLPALTETSIERGQDLFSPDDPATHVFFPSTCVLSVVTHMASGQNVESSTVGPETATPLLAALAGQRVKARIFAQIGGGAIRIPASVLRGRAAENPALMTLLLRHAAAIGFQAEQGVACNVLHDAPQRLARWILMTQDRTGGRALPLTQDYMAVMTGVQRTTISVVATQLRDAGLIRYSRGNLEVIDRAGLEAYACECYRAIREEFDGLRNGQDPAPPIARTP